MRNRAAVSLDPIRDYAADGHAMSRPNSPQQFVLDEVSARRLQRLEGPRELTSGGPHRRPLSRSQETRNSTSSHTDSLLGLPEARLNGDADAYPPRRASDDEKRGTTDESDLDGQGLLSGRDGLVERVNRGPIRIPTRDEVNGVKQNPRRRPRHIKMVLLGLVSLLGTAWLATWVSSFGMSSGGQIQVILMISDGMGELFEACRRSVRQEDRSLPSLLRSGIRNAGTILRPIPRVLEFDNVSRVAFTAERILLGKLGSRLPWSTGRPGSSASRRHARRHIQGE